MADGGSETGLPTAAKARLAEIRDSGTWGSALSTAEFAAIRSTGFEPVGQVLGAAVYNVGYTGGFSCPGAWTGFGRYGVPAVGITTVSGDGNFASFGPMVATLYQARRDAIDRMTAECTALGGHGVVGVTLSIGAFPAWRRGVQGARHRRARPGPAAGAAVHLRPVRPGLRQAVRGRLERRPGAGHLRRGPPRRLAHRHPDPLGGGEHRGPGLYRGGDPDPPRRYASNWRRTWPGWAPTGWS